MTLVARLQLTNCPMPPSEIVLHTIMSHRNLQIPEPMLPEHALIRDAAPVPELSAGFKQKVMADCKVGITRAARVRRWKVTGTVAAVCSLALMISLVLPTANNASPQSVTEQKQTTPPPFSSDSLGYPSGSSSIVVDQVKRPVKDAESSQMNQLIEQLDQRQQMFDANMLPKFR